MYKYFGSGKHVIRICICICSSINKTLGIYVIFNDFMIYAPTKTCMPSHGMDIWLIITKTWSKLLKGDRLSTETETSTFSSASFDFLSYLVGSRFLKHCNLELFSNLYSISKASFLPYLSYLIHVGWCCAHCIICHPFCVSLHAIYE